MKVVEIVCVFLGCGVGGVCRYALGAWLLKGVSVRFPWATFAANAVGCLLIGLLLGWFSRRPSQLLALLTVTGFCGGFTTFSTFANETLRLFREGAPALAVGYVLLSLASGLLLAALGWRLMARGQFF